MTLLAKAMPSPNVAEEAMTNRRTTNYIAFR